MKDRIEASLGASIRVMEHIARDLPDDIERATILIVEGFRRGGKVLVCGNGGSAADAQHMAAELMGTTGRDREPLPCVALTTDTSVITAWSNDHGFETVFARQLEGIGQQGDVLVAVSTSGDSPNVVQAVRVARERGLRTVALLGGRTGTLHGTSDVDIVVRSQDTARIQEGHIAIIHTICGLVEEEMFGPVES